MGVSEDRGYPLYCRKTSKRAQNKKKQPKRYNYIDRFFLKRAVLPTENRIPLKGKGTLSLRKAPYRKEGTGRDSLSLIPL